jgi:uncharacterized protein
MKKSPVIPMFDCPGGIEQSIAQSEPIDLDALNNYLIGDHSPDHCMGLSELDGFLTAIVIGPEPILPCEWLPVILDAEESEFGTEAEMRMVVGTIIGRHNEIVARFNSDPVKIGPIFWERPEGVVIASDWAGGFLDAVTLRPMAWKPLLDHERCSMLMVPFLLLNGDIKLGDGPESVTAEEEFLVVAPDIITACAAGIHEFWKNRRRKPVAKMRRTQRKESSDTVMRLDEATKWIIGSN